MSLPGITLDDWIELKNITPDNAEQIINDLRQHWEGSCGGRFNGKKVDYQCSPKMLELNRISDGEYRVYTWKDVLKYITEPKQVTFW